MDLTEAIRGRRSIRKFKPDSVNENDLREIIEAATLAPNAENQQMWHFVAVTNRELIQKIGDSVSVRLDAPASSVLTALMPIRIPAQSPGARPRLPLNEAYRLIK